MLVASCFDAPTLVHPTNLCAHTHTLTQPSTNVSKASVKCVRSFAARGMRCSNCVFSVAKKTSHSNCSEFKKSSVNHFYRSNRCILSWMSFLSILIILIQFANYSDCSQCLCTFDVRNSHYAAMECIRTECVELQNWNEIVRGCNQWTFNSMRI